jgi:4-amino-4-deoxy-L-arabinose transferase-like glycosyltransferase
LSASDWSSFPVAENSLSNLHFSRARLTVVLLGIALFALAIRWYELPARGIIARDEAWYTYSAHGLQMRIQNFFTERPITSSTAYLETPDFERISSNNAAGKPTYVALLWSIGALRRSWGYDNTLGLAVLAGTASTIVIYWLSRQARLSVPLALLAGLIGATSFTSTYFSRIGYPHALLILVHTLALAYYLRADTRRPSYKLLVVAGLLWGIGLSLHMSLALALPGLLIVEGYRYRRDPQKSLTVLFRRFLALGSGIIVVLLGWEIAYRVASSVLGPGPGVVSLTGSFLQDALAHSGLGGAPSYSFAGKLLFYPLALLGLENPLTCLFAFIGIVGVWWIHRTAESCRTLSIILLTNLLLLIVFPAKYGRQLAPTLSIWPVFVALGLAHIVTMGRRLRFFHTYKQVLVPVLIASVLLFNLYWAWPLLTTGTRGSVQAARWIQANAPSDTWVVASEISDAAVLNYYLPGRVVIWPGDDRQLPAQVRWYIKGPTDHRASSWPQLASLVDGYVPTVTLRDAWHLLRPHHAIGGNWLLIPWWRWSKGPKSFQPGLDDVVQVYWIH